MGIEADAVVELVAGAVAAGASPLRGLETSDWVLDFVPKTNTQEIRKADNAREFRSTFRTVGVCF